MSTALTEYIENRSRWVEILTGDDVHAIEKQIQNLLWNDTVYRTFNEGRRISEITNDASTGFAGTLFELIDFSFFNYQVINIRRLIEAKSKKPQRAVYSLKTLLEDIREKGNLITRENYVTFDGTPYEDKDHSEIIAGKVRWTPRPVFISHSRHSLFDRLSKISNSNRTPQDRIHNDIFLKIESLLKKTRLIESYCNKYAAHAADPSNRGTVDSKLDSITLLELEKCYQALICSADLMASIIDDGIAITITPQFDQLNNWDKPFITSNDKKTLNAYWRERMSTFEKWQADRKF